MSSMAQKHAHAAVPAALAGPGRLPESRGHVLIVEGEISTREFMDSALRGAGYLTARAINDREALEIAEQFGPFDLLVTSEATADAHGRALAERLRAREPWVKVLYLTGDPGHPRDSTRQAWDDEAFVEKPSSVLGLLSAVSTLLAKRAPRPSS